MSPLQRRAANFDLCLDSWPLSSEGSLACNTYCGEASVHGHLRGPMKLTPFAERLAEELSLPVFTTSVCRDRDSNTQPSACRANILTNCATAAVKSLQVKIDMIEINISRNLIKAILDLDFSYII